MLPRFYLLINSIFIIATCLLLELDRLYAQSILTNDIRQFRFVMAKTGLTFRSSPSIEAQTIEIIPFGKVVQIVNELQDTVNVQGNISNWMEVQYKWNKGFVVGGYLSESPENPDKKSIKQKDYFGVWKGDWKCGKDYSNLNIKKNGNFSGWLFEGGDVSGCGGSTIKGTWIFSSSGEICLKSNTERSCFFILNKKLITNLSSAPGFKENYGSEFMSGLSRIK